MYTDRELYVRVADPIRRGDASCLKQEFGVTVEGDQNEQEVKDLEKLFRKVANISKQYVSGEDKEALAKTAKLVERFGHLSSLSGVDLSVDVERSVTIFAAQVDSEMTNLPTQAAGQQQPTPVTASGTATPGGAPSTVAAIPQSSTGTSAPTQPSTDAAVPTSDAATRPLRRRRMRRTQPPATGPSEFPATMVSSALFSYQSVNLTSIL
jgi:hypothetical protein